MTGGLQNQVGKCRTVDAVDPVDESSHMILVDLSYLRIRIERIQVCLVAPQDVLHKTTGQFRCHSGSSTVKVHIHVVIQTPNGALTVCLLSAVPLRDILLGQLSARVSMTLMPFRPAVSRTWSIPLKALSLYFPAQTNYSHHYHKMFTSFPLTH